MSFWLLVVTALTVASLPAMALEIIAHRGASGDAPENTISAFKLGYGQRADACELDIHLSGDGKVVVMHDVNTARTSGITNELAAQTWAQVRRLEVGQWGRWKAKGFSERVPALEEVLALVPRGKRLFVEIKCGPEILPELRRVLQRGGNLWPPAVILSFDYETVKAARTQIPGVEVCWLAAPDKKDKARPAIEELIGKAVAAKLDGLDLEAGFPIDPLFVQKVHAAGLKLYTWTVDDPELARKLEAAGVDGITTNRPGWLREQLAKAGQ